jgi:hypothetical protein
MKFVLALLLLAPTIADDLKRIERGMAERGAYKAIAEADDWDVTVYQFKGTWCATAVNKLTGATVSKAVIFDGDWSAGKVCK